MRKSALLLAPTLATIVATVAFAPTAMAGNPTKDANTDAVGDVDHASETSETIENDNSIDLLNGKAHVKAAKFVTVKMSVADVFDPAVATLDGSYQEFEAQFIPMNINDRKTGVMIRHNPVVGCQAMSVTADEEPVILTDGVKCAVNADANTVTFSVLLADIPGDPTQIGTLTRASVYSAEEDRRSVDYSDEGLYTMTKTGKRK